MGDDYDPLTASRAGSILSSKYWFCDATVDDAVFIAQHRAAMFAEMKRVSRDGKAHLQEVIGPVIRRLLAGGEYLAVLAYDGDGTLCGSAAAQLRLTVPRPDAAGTTEALIMNVYVEPSCRGRGLARVLTQAVIDAVRGCGIDRIALHPSEAARNLYLKMGFQATGELRYKRPDK